MGTLRIVATPIGNLEDVTLRALRVLAEADLVLAEDTRHTRILLDRHGVAARPRSLHAHNEAARIREVLAALDAGGAVALVSDAGTPLVSDPGGRLVAAALAAGHAVEAVPGASAVLAALTVSGLPVDAFSFHGFLPRRAGARTAALAALRDRRETLVFFESPRRTAGTLAALLAAFGDRPACVARELTKRHEEVARGPLSDLVRRFAEGARGEVTIVVSGASPEPEASVEVGAFDAEIRARLAAGETPRDLATDLASRPGVRRRDAYARIQALRGKSGG